MNGYYDNDIHAPRFIIKGDVVSKISASTKLSQVEFGNRIKQVKKGKCKDYNEAIAYLLGKYLVYTPYKHSAETGQWDWKHLRFHSAYDTESEAKLAEQRIQSKYIARGQ